MKKIILLGGSGSIGRQVIDLIDQFNDELELISVSVFSSFDFLNTLTKKYKSIKQVGIVDKTNIGKIGFDNVISGEDCNIKLLDLDGIVVNAISGTDGLKATIESIRKNKTIILANKESIVCGGEFIKEELLKHPKSKIIPVDSEHSAIMQCLLGEDKDDVDKLIITSSGGPFLNVDIKDLENVSVSDAINHPTWSMGKKISVDSSTMFNKGLEIIEAHYLFDIDYDHIEAVIEKTSTIHSLIQFKDGNVKALLGPKDMRLPILYALLDKNRVSNLSSNFNILELNNIKFEKIDLDKFPSLSLAYEVGRKGQAYTLAYCVANEICVNAFIDNKIKYLDIYKFVKKTIDKLEDISINNIDEAYMLIDKVKSLTLNIMKGE